MPGVSAYEVKLIPFPVLQPMSFKRNKYLEAIIGNKSFSQAGHLRTHMIIQTGKKVHNVENPVVELYPWKGTCSHPQAVGRDIWCPMNITIWFFMDKDKNFYIVQINQSEERHGCD